MRPSKIRQQRREQQRRIDKSARALESAAVDFCHVLWNPTSYTHPTSLLRERRAALCDAAMEFVSRVDGEEMPEQAQVTPLKTAKAGA